MNRLFVQDLMSAPPPCFAAGYIEELGKTTGFLAMRPRALIPKDALSSGFSFGHSVQEYDGEILLHFGFKFYGHKTYHCVVQPQNPIIMAVIDKMLETQDYFFFAINTDDTITSFRSKMESADLASLRTNRLLFDKAKCSLKKYDDARTHIQKEVFPYDEEMMWVCRD